MTAITSIADLSLAPLPETIRITTWDGARGRPGGPETYPDGIPHVSPVGAWAEIVQGLETEATRTIPDKRRGLWVVGGYSPTGWKTNEHVVERSILMLDFDALGADPEPFDRAVALVCGLGVAHLAQRRDRLDGEIRGRILIPLALDTDRATFQARAERFVRWVEEQTETEIDAAPARWSQAVYLYAQVAGLTAPVVTVSRRVDGLALDLRGVRVDGSAVRRARRTTAAARVVERFREQRPEVLSAAAAAARACFAACGGGPISASGRADCPFPEDHDGRGRGYVSISERGIQCWGGAHRSGDGARQFQRKLRAANPSAFTTWTLNAARRTLEAEIDLGSMEDEDDPTPIPGPEARARLTDVLRARGETDRLLVHVDTGAGKTFAMARDLVERLSGSHGIGVLALPTIAACEDVEREHREHAASRGVAVLQPKGSGKVCRRLDVLNEAGALGLSPRAYGACFACEHRSPCEREMGVTAAELAAQGGAPVVLVTSHALTDWADTLDDGAHWHRAHRSGAVRFLYVDENPRDPVVAVEVSAEDLAAFRAAAARGGVLDAWAAETVQRRVRDQGTIAAARAALEAFDPATDWAGHEELQRALAAAEAGTVEHVRKYASAGERARRLLSGEAGEVRPPAAYLEIAKRPEVRAVWRTWQRLIRAREVGIAIPAEGGLRGAAWNPLIARADVLASATPDPAVEHVLGAANVRRERIRVADACEVSRVWVRTGQATGETFKLDRDAWAAAFRRHVLPEVGRARRALVAVSTKAQAEVARGLLPEGVDLVHMAQTEGRNEWRDCDLVIAFGTMVPATPAFGRGSDVESGIDDHDWAIVRGQNELAQVLGRARTRAERRPGEPERVRLVVVGTVVPRDWGGLGESVGIPGAGGADLTLLSPNRVKSALDAVVQRAGSKRKAADLLGVTEKAVRNWTRGAIPVERFEQIVLLAAELEPAPGEDDDRDADAA